MSTFFSRRAPGFKGLNRVEWVAVDPVAKLKRPTQRPALAPYGAETSRLVKQFPRLPIVRIAHRASVLWGDAPLVTAAVAAIASVSVGVASILYGSLSLISAAAVVFVPAVCLQRLLLRGHPNRFRADLEGKVCVVTGASHGIGAEVAVQLAAMGAEVICTGRGDPITMKRAVRNDIVPVHVVDADGGTGQGAHARNVGRRLHFFYLDLSSLASRRDFANSISEMSFVRERGIHILVNNAGAIFPLPAEHYTPQDQKHSNRSDVNRSRHNAQVGRACNEYFSFASEPHLIVNSLGPIHLTELLLPHIVRATDSERRKGGRIINVTADAHSKVGTWWLEDYDLDERFQLTKLLHEVHTGVYMNKFMAREQSTEKGSYSLTNFGHRVAASRMVAKCYGLSKLMNIYHADSLVQDRGVCAVSVCPGGMVSSAFFRHMRRPLPLHYVSDTQAVNTIANMLCFRSPSEASQSVINACLRPDIVAGGYYSGCKLTQWGKSPIAVSASHREQALAWAYGVPSMQHLRQISQKMHKVLPPSIGNSANGVPTPAEIVPRKDIWGGKKW